MTSNSAIIDSKSCLEQHEIDLSDQRKAMERLFKERSHIGMTLWDLEALSGVAINSAYGWKKGDRAPRLANFVALATVLGFEVILRKKVPSSAISGNAPPRTTP